MRDVEEINRLLFLMERQGRHLLTTTGRLFSQPVDTKWVEALEENPDLAERLDAFVARFGRMQDTIGGRLVPELRRHTLETPGAALDNLNRMEKRGLLSSVVGWVEARNSRNLLVYEYMRDPEEFASVLKHAHALVPLLIGTYNPLNDSAKARVGNQASRWPRTRDTGR